MRVHEFKDLVKCRSYVVDFASVSDSPNGVSYDINDTMEAVVLYFHDNTIRGEDLISILSGFNTDYELFIADDVYHLPIDIIDGHICTSHILYDVVSMSDNTLILKNNFVSMSVLYINLLGTNNLGGAYVGGKVAVKIEDEVVVDIKLCEFVYHFLF